MLCETISITLKLQNYANCLKEVITQIGIYQTGVKEKTNLNQTKKEEKEREKGEKINFTPAPNGITYIYNQ